MNGVYVYTPTYMCVSVWMCTHTCTQVHAQVVLCVLVCLIMYVFAYTHICIAMYKRIHVHVSLYAHVLSICIRSMCLHTRMCQVYTMCVFICIHLYVLRVCALISVQGCIHVQECTLTYVSVFICVKGHTCVHRDPCLH